MSESIIREKRIISLNSNNATTYYNGSFLSDMSFDFANILSPDRSILYVEAGVGSAEIPASFFNIETSNNVFNYRLNATNFSITIAPGNYNYSTLISTMTTLLLANGHTFTFSLNRSTNLLTMTCSTGTWNQINGSSIYFVLGFAENTTYNIVANTITFPFLFNLLGQKRIKIYSNNISIDSYDSVNKQTSNLLASISVNQAGFNLITFQNTDGVYSRMRNHYLSTVDIQLRDELNNLYNFNGINWTISIHLILYRRIDTLLDELKLQESSSASLPVEVENK